MLSFSSNEVKHWTFKRWTKIFDYFKRYYNFKTKQMLFEIEPDQQEKNKSYEWFDD